MLKQLKRVKALTIVLTLILCLTPSVIYANPMDYGNMIDVSDCNGWVDWDSVQYDCPEGVIIRLGIGDDLESQDDSKFEYNVSECERLGIPYGIYIYSYALTYDEINSEISHALRKANECNPSLGVWFDMEDADGYKQRHDMNVYESGNMLTDFCIMFVSAMRDNGYRTGVYANYNYFTNVLNMDRLRATEGYHTWLAHWGINEPSIDCTIWQYGDNGYGFDGDIYYGFGDDDITATTEVTVEPEDIDYSSIYEHQIDDSVNTYYQVKVNGEWLPMVANNSDYAGIYGQPITDVAINVDKGYAEYRVHTNGRWLSWIDSRDTNINDYYNGYAGNGTAIDAIQIYYHTSDDLRSISGGQWASYYTSSTNKTDGFYSTQWDIATDSGMDGYAGSFGRPMDALVFTVQHR